MATVTAADMRAMRKAIELLERLEERPREVRRCFIPRDSVVRVAVELANVGGRASRVLDDGETDTGRADGVVGLMAAGWLHWAPVRGWELDAALLSAFAHEVLQ